MKVADYHCLAPVFDAKRLNPPMPSRANLFDARAATSSVAFSDDCPSATQPAAAHVWSVGALCRAAGESLQSRFGWVSVKGEISGFSAAASGHCYFTLKDEAGQMRCAMFRRAAQALTFTPREGDSVQIRARLAVYEQRGDLQLVVEEMQRSGAGALFEEFLRLKARLQSLGLFDAERKRPIPSMPRGVGLVTSLGAAALRDVATTWARRAPHVPIVLAAAAVQGAGAAQEIIAALQTLYAIAEKTSNTAQNATKSPKTAENAPKPRANKRALGPEVALPPIDVIVLVRGGGSMQDLWSFNDEALAQVIAASPVPIVTGVGHETDFTIADFCADLRAPTPTAAAELVAPARSQCLGELAALQSRMQRAATRALERQSQRLDLASLRLSAPAQQLQQRRTQLAQFTARLHTAAHNQLRAQRQALPLHQLRQTRAAAHCLQNAHHRNAQLATRIELLAPQQLMRRGWALLTASDGQTPITTTAAAPVGAALKAHLADGILDVTVTQPKLI